MYFLLGHEIEHYHCHELRFSYCNPSNLIFSSLKLENGLKKHVRNVARIKYEFVELVVILVTFNTIVFQDFGYFLFFSPEQFLVCSRDE